MIKTAEKYTVYYISVVFTNRQINGLLVSV